MRHLKKIIMIASIAGLVVCSGCDVKVRPNKGKAPPTGMLVAATDWLAVGSVAVIHGAPPTEVSLSGAITSSDPAVRYYNGKVYVINRSSGNIQVLDPTQNYETIAQYSTGNASNPQDIAFVSDNMAFISCLHKPNLMIVDPKNGKDLGSVNLAEYADKDGFPEPVKMTIVYDRLFVALERLDPSFAPADKGMIVVIDTGTGKVVATVTLATMNPNTDLIYDEATSRIYVGCTGNWGMNDGGIETITVDLGADKYKADGVLIGEDVLGGDISALAMVSSTQAYALATEYPAGHLLRFNPSNPAEGVTEIWSTSSYVPAITIDSNGYLFLADADANNPGVRIWDTKTDTQITSKPLDVGMPPVSFAELK